MGALYGPMDRPHFLWYTDRVKLLPDTLVH